MGITLLQVDAFTSQPFAGNPAAVCLLRERRDAAWMQCVAKEMNLSETAFLLRQKDGYELRWFTPRVEVDLCGHATLASAHALWESGELDNSAQARFHTRSGLLTAERTGDWIELNFPAEPEQPTEAPPDLLRALGVKPVYTGKNRMDYILEVESEEIVRGVQPDFTLLETVPARGVMVTSRSAVPEFDFVSRFFGPQSGVPEDLVTGSAHSAWAPIGGRSWARMSSSPIRPRHAAASCACAWKEIGCAWAGKRLRCCAANCSKHPGRTGFLPGRLRESAGGG